MAETAVRVIAEIERGPVRRPPRPAVIVAIAGTVIWIAIRAGWVTIAVVPINRRLGIGRWCRIGTRPSSGLTSRPSLRPQFSAVLQQGNKDVTRDSMVLQSNDLRCARRVVDWRILDVRLDHRSEERRVGKECR